MDEADSGRRRPALAADILARPLHSVAGDDGDGGDGVFSPIC